MRRKVLADGICKALQQVPDLLPLIELNEDQAVQTVAVFQPDVVVLEVSESRADGILVWLQKIHALRSQWPGIKFLILCPETQEQLSRDAVEAMKSHRIDDFVFYDTSLKYLVAKLQAL